MFNTKLLPDNKFFLNYSHKNYTSKVLTFLSGVFPNGEIKDITVMQNLNPRFLIINQGEYQLLILPTSNEKSNAQLIRLDFAFEGDECEIVKTEDDDEPFEFM